MNFDAVMIGNEQPLFLRIVGEVSDRAAGTLTKVRCLVMTRCLSCLKSKDHEQDIDLAFLRLNGIAPFPVRLARAVAEATRMFLSNPVAFIKAIAEEYAASREMQKRRRAGMSAAFMVYAAVLSIIYGSYSISHRNASTFEPKKRIEVTLLAPPPAIRLKPAPAKQDGGSKNHLSLPKQSVEQLKPQVVKATVEPRPLEQLQSKPEPVEIARVGAVEPSASSSGNGTGGGTGTGNGSGSGSGSGSKLGSTSTVDYNGVFSVGSVTVRPQILGRPIPAYTDEARRNQVEGSVKLSVVLKADGAVSDIRIARGLGYGLDERAMEAARQLRFLPGEKDGHPVSVRVSLEFKFSLL